MPKNRLKDVVGHSVARTTKILACQTLDIVVMKCPRCLMTYPWVCSDPPRQLKTGDEALRLRRVCGTTAGSKSGYISDVGSIGDFEQNCDVNVHFLPSPTVAFVHPLSRVEALVSQADWQTHLLVFLQKQTIGYQVCSGWSLSSSQPPALVHLPFVDVPQG